ncbi:hypothetical protein NDU88_009286 [Pleurodeles waltl]|uniref:Uncharacterized protein n=1 Tax=Pleurodeles waltl TaxID=8319 RepID=A0AAV7RZZ1_PLEWA|nr:hypothetical protein NDU88_009286 [Pleurodeles waltl]
MQQGAGAPGPAVSSDPPQPILQQIESRESRTPVWPPVRAPIGHQWGRQAGEDCQSCEGLQPEAVLRWQPPDSQIDPPTAEEAQEEPQRVVAAVTSLGGSSLSTMSPNKGVSGEQSDSDNDSLTSSRSSIVLPAVNPGTADELI